MLKRANATLCLSAIILIGSTGVIFGANFKKGLDAARNGNFEMALREWTPLAEEGDATAQINLGVMYEDGKGVSTNYKTALKWYKRAAQQGDPRGQVNLGLMYAKGKGVRPDNIYAYMWLYIAALTGDGDAVSNRDIVAKTMSSDDILSTQALAHRCITTKYKRC